MTVIPFGSQHGIITGYLLAANLSKELWALVELDVSTGNGQCTAVYLKSY
jgi:hypothetical protein